MRKWGIAALIAITAIVSVSVASAASHITLIVNGKQAATEVKVIDGVTYVPLRAAGELLGATVDWNADTSTITISGSQAAAANSSTTYDVTLNFAVDRYPETAAHIKAAIAAGESVVCTIDRDGADENREESLDGIPTKDGYDRDEWPMAVCVEGGAGASVAYVDPSDNRGAGSWVSNQLEDYADGTRVLFVISGTVNASVDFATPGGTASGSTAPQSVSTPAPVTAPFPNCTAAREAGAAPLYVGDPGYSTKLDRDRDGVACE